MKKRIVRHGLATAFAMSVGIALAACSGATGGSGVGSLGTGDYSGPTVTINFWNGFTGGNGLVLVPKLVAQFNKEHKTIVVNDVPMPWADIAAKMPLAVKAGKGPDVTVAHGDDVATYAAQGLLLKADNIVKSLGYTASDFPAGLLKSGNYNGSQYGIPWSVTPLGLYVNKDVLKKAGLDPASIPTDKASYLKALAALKTVGVQGEWVNGFWFMGTTQFESLLWQFGGDLFNKDVSKAMFNSNAGVQALTYMTDLIKQGYSPENVAESVRINALIAGKAAFQWDGVWQTSNPALAGVNWTAVAVPQIGTQQAVWSSSTHWMFTNNKGQDKNKTAAAATFVKWMNDHASGWPATGELPAKNSVRNDPALLKNYPNLKPFLAELPYAHYETVAPGITNTTVVIVNAVNEAVLFKKTPKQALDDAATKVNQLLAQNKSQYGG